jgi:GT2 family glycosyltransferase
VLITALEEDAQVGLATSKILLLADPERVNTCGNQVHFTGLTMCRGLGQNEKVFARPEEVDAVSGASFAIRRDLFDKIGGFDPSFFLYLEDTDLSWRARVAGYRCMYVPASVVYHDYALRFGPQKTFYQERNRYLMLLKNLRWPTLFILLPALLLAEVVTWGFALLRERSRLANKWRAYAWLVEHWAEVMASRRKVQELRTVRDRDLIGRFQYRLDFQQTADDRLARLAHLVFDSSFFVLHRLSMALIWW